MIDQHRKKRVIVIVDPLLGVSVVGKTHPKEGTAQNGLTQQTFSVYSLSQNVRKNPTAVVGAPILTCSVPTWVSIPLN